MEATHKKCNVVDDFHGTKVADPYRWLEDPSLEDTKKWTEKQNRQTDDFLQSHPNYYTIKQQISKLSDYETYTIPQKVGDYYYFHKNSDLNHQPTFYRCKSLNKPELEVVIDPNTLRNDGTASLRTVSFSHDSKLLAYSIAFNGSDEQEINIKNLETGEKYPETIQLKRQSAIAWGVDNDGFYYSNYPQSASKHEQAFNHSVYWHQLGTAQTEDELVFNDPDQKELAYEPRISDDKSYLILRAHNGTEPKSDIYYRSLKDSQSSFKRLIGNRHANYTMIYNDDNMFYLLTNDEAPKGRVIAIDINRPQKENWKEIIPEQEHTIVFVRKAHDYLTVSSLNDVDGELTIYKLDGTFVKKVPLPKQITVEDVSQSGTTDKIFISYTSFVEPTQIVSYHIENKKLDDVFKIKSPVDCSTIEVNQVFYPSKDGTKIPMYLVHKKGLDLTGDHPVLLYGYGGYVISQTPKFSPSQMMWIESGGIYAVANLRGGGEYGRDWHEAGIFEKKQNVFDDFITAAEWLIDNKYTKPKKLAIMGGSNGGLLVGACMLQRPELFGAVLCLVPVTDMLRFQHFTFGRYWTTEFGHAEENKDHFEFMYEYSPLHNVKSDITYPPILITTADHDDRVVPAHAKKFAATLQEKQPNNEHIFLMEEKNTGHGDGKPLSKVIDNHTKLYTFLFKTLDTSWQTKH